MKTNVEIASQLRKLLAAYPLATMDWPLDLMIEAATALEEPMTDKVQLFINDKKVYEVLPPAAVDHGSLKRVLRPATARIIGSASAPPPPSGNVINLTPSDGLASIQSKLNGAAVGTILKFPNSVYNLGGALRGKPGITLWSDGGTVISNGSFDFSGVQGVWTIRGASPGHGFTFNSSAYIDADNAVGASGTQPWFIGNCVFTGQPSAGMSGSAIRSAGIRLGTFINNDFINCQGNVLGCYDWDHITLDGNYFEGCGQPLSLNVPENNDPNWGNSIWFLRNVFLKTKRCAIEMGPGGQQRFSDLVFDSNFFDDFENQGGEQWGTLLAISMVGLASTGGRVTGNFFRRGDYNPGNVGIAIEWAGPGDISNNTIWNFAYAALLYNSDWFVHGNQYYTDSTSPDYGYQQNNAGSGTISGNVKLLSPPPVPQHPVRIEW